LDEVIQNGIDILQCNCVMKKEKQRKRKETQKRKRKDNFRNLYGGEGNRISKIHEKRGSRIQQEERDLL
jgi:hypothetical protein